MCAASTRELLLFVAGEPGPAEDPLRDIQTSVARRLMGAVVGGWWQGLGTVPPRTSAAGGALDAKEPLWHFPPSQIQCINLVSEIAGSLGARIALIDVNRPERNQNLANQWVGPDGILPVLARKDGACLQGMEQFTPRRIRSFIRGA